MKFVSKQVVLSMVLTGLLSVTLSATVREFKIDKTHSNVDFSVRHMALSNTKGTFTDYDGVIKWDSDGKQSAITGTVQVKSIDTRDEKRDNHLRGEDFFKTEKYPEMSLISKSISKSGRKYNMVADFTLRGVTRTIKVPLTVSSIVKDPWGNNRIQFSTTFVIDRQDYGLNFNKVTDNGGLIVGNNVTIALDIEAIESK
jgi:polyisoprenoid-binding protein YceI